MKVGRWIDRHCHVVYVVMALPLMIWFACRIPRSRVLTSPRTSRAPTR